MSKDYYRVLEIDKSASENDIKSSYRKLAMKYHPDRNKDNKISEEKFKEISEAYEILSDPQKRRNYDQFGTTNGNPNMNMNDIFSNFGDIFGDIFGGNRQSTQSNKGTDIKIKININYIDVLHGIKKVIKLKRKYLCNVCDGSGGVETDKCNRCDGNGKRVNIQNSPFGQMRSIVNCNYCNGFGYSIKKPCNNCNSSGYELKEEQITIDIPPGVESGMELRQRGSGNYIKNGIPGDLVVSVEVDDIYGYVRNNNNIYTNLNITIPEAILGCQKVIKSIEGNNLTFNVEPGTQSGKKIKLSNQGLPDFNYHVRGDLICTISINIPSSITDKERELIEELKKLDNFK